MASREHYVIELSAAVPDGTGRDDPRETQREVPVSGRLSGLSIGFPASDVGVGLVTNEGEGEALFPRNGEFVEYGTDGDFPLSRPVSAGETLEARFYNESGKGDQYVPVLAGLLIDK